MHSYHLDIVTVIVGRTRELHGNQDDRALEMETGAMGHREDVKEMNKEDTFYCSNPIALPPMAKRNRSTTS